MKTFSHNIVQLQPGEIFVFGSDEVGKHNGGAAKVAKLKFGAVQNQAEGLMGQSYGIPTMVNHRKRFDNLSKITFYIERFIQFAKRHPELTFYVTPIGCGVAGYKFDYIADKLKECREMENVVLHQKLAEHLAD